MTITQSVALDRLGLMVASLEENIKIALGTKAVLESGNRIIKLNPQRKCPGASAYDTIHQSLTINLALSLARIFDPGTKSRHPNKRDIASIPLIIRLLKQRRCQKALTKRAKLWVPGIPHFEEIQAKGCQRAIDKAISSYAKLKKIKPAHRLRNLRNYQLAHSMMRDMLEKIPTYNDLFFLMDIARDVTQSSMLAINGENVRFKDYERISLNKADRFWEEALK